jgi:hypothetical protein
MAANVGVSQEVTYLHSLGYALFTPCLVYVRHEFECRRARQLCAPGRGWILEVKHVVDTSLDRVDNIQLRESGLRCVGYACMVQDSTQVIPRGCIVRRKRNLLFGKALKGDDVVRDNKDIAMVAGQIVSALCSADASDHGQNEGINLRQFAPRRLLARPSLVLIFE